jgi:hypothetical protein
MHIMIRLGLAALVLSGVACKKGEAAGLDGGAKTGLGDPSNNPEVVALAKSVLTTCGWDAKKAFDACDQMKPWREKSFENVDATLLNFIDDTDVKVRWLGVSGLSRWGRTYRSDKTQGARLLAALEKEPADSVLDAEMTFVMLNVSDADLLKSLKAYAVKPTTAFDVRAVLASWWNDEQSFDIVKSLTTGDKKAQKEAVQGYAIHFDKHRDEACKFWTDHLEDDDKDVRAAAVGHLTGGWGGNTTGDSQGNWYVSGGGGGPSIGGDKFCDDAQVEHALTLIAARVKANTVDESNYVYGLTALVKHGHTPAIKKKAETELVALVATKGARQRSFALSQLVDADEKQLALAKTYEKDDELKYTVKSILDRKAKK